jgi:hypothetical protein
LRKKRSSLMGRLKLWVIKKAIIISFYLIFQMRD